MALSSENIPDDLKAICEKITEHFPSRIMKEDWKWRTPFSTKRIETKEATDDEIINILNDLYGQAMQFEKQLVQIMSQND